MNMTNLTQEILIMELETIINNIKQREYCHDGRIEKTMVYDNPINPNKITGIKYKLNFTIQI